MGVQRWAGFSVYMESTGAHSYVDRKIKESICMNSDVVLLPCYVGWNAGVSSKSMLAAKNLKHTKHPELKLGLIGADF